MRKSGIEKDKDLSEVNVRLQILQQVTEAVHSTLNLGNVFIQITDGFVHSMGYTNAFIATLNKEKNHFEVKALSTKKQLLPKINNIIGFSLRNLSFPADPELSAGVKAVIEGRVLIAKTLAEVAYPLISKKACSVLQHLRETKNYIVVPLKIEKEVVGGILITSSQEEISEEELEMIKGFAHAASNAIRNAQLHIQTKQAEERLQIEKARLDQLFESALEGIVMVDEDGRVMRVNSEFVRMFGYAADEVQGRFVDELVVPSEELDKGVSITKKVSRGKNIAFEASRQRKDGTLIDVSVLASPIIVNGKVVASYAIYRDISERKKAEKVQASMYKISEAAHAAENLEELYRSIHNTITELMPAKNNFYIAIYDEASERLNFPYFVDEYEENPGPQKLGKGLTEYVLRTGKPLLASPEVFDELEKKGEVESVGPSSIDWLGVPLKTKGRTIGVLTVQSYTEGIRYSEEDKNILAFISEQVAMAIERKQAEEALKESEEKYRIQFEEALDAIFIADAETGIITNCNNAASKLVGRAKSELVGKPQRILHPPEEITGEFSRTFKSHLKEKEGRILEAQVINKDGEKKDVAIKANIFEFRGKKMLQGIFRDITERKLAEEKIKAALEEKEVMFREIHHRVKNNMQIISSLLRLQSRQIKDKKILDCFNVSQNRIRSMVLIHESLYQSKDLARINFSDYINRLTIHLFSIYRTGANSINLKVEVGDVFLDINRAIPCGLIINELVSNSLKHAFPDGKKGEIAVKMNEDKRGNYTLVVKDTGIGFPEKVHIHKTETLGLQLVTDLVSQLNGNIKLTRLGGTEFRIVF